VDDEGKPFFWLGDTQWELFHALTPEEARTILERRKQQGFSAIQVMVAGAGEGKLPSATGEPPWRGNAPSSPNEAYFRNVDRVMEAARETEMILVPGVYHVRQKALLTTANARQYARWVAQRYADVPNIIWSMYPAAEPEFVPVLGELAAGLREGDGGAHMITVHPDPSPASSSFIHEEGWLDFNSMQTWRDVKLIYPMVVHDYGLKPVKPVLMAEGAYEAGSEYRFDVTPLWIRRQAYYSYLAGGHHTYGHNDCWRVLRTWKQALDAPGAVQMGTLKRIFMARREWWLLVPDQSVFASGGQTEGDVLRLAARHRDGKWAMIYLAEKASFSVNMDKVAGAGVSASWVNPKTGDAVPAGSLPNSGQRSFSTPDGWEDALLILEAA
jgi:hypothetical protein